jgi:quinol monooxygenase YgiN
MTIRLILYGKVKDGMTEAFKDAGAQMTAAANDEPGTTTYRWYLSEDGHFVNEDVYTDEAALFAHVGAATESGMMNDYTGSMDLAGVMVLDPVNDEAKEALAAFAATHYAMIEGF